MKGGGIERLSFEYGLIRFWGLWKASDAPRTNGCDKRCQSDYMIDPTWVIYSGLGMGLAGLGFFYFLFYFFQLEVFRLFETQDEFEYEFIGFSLFKM